MGVKCYKNGQFTVLCMVNIAINGPGAVRVAENQQPRVGWHLKATTS